MPRFLSCLKEPWKLGPSTIEVSAEIPDGVPDNVVRTVTENSKTLKFTSHGFEIE